ncbi:MAG: helix-turn-helix domain-containing protein [Sediminibacterium sp.]|jgi:putative transposase|nr:helix-turn-helix domain-containing protein [Sediminibacterium sp.]
MEKQHIKLSKSEQSFLTDLLSKGTLKVQKYKRATALQLLDSGKTLVETMNILQVSYPTLISWRNKYQSEGLTFLDDKPRSGRPLEIDGLQRAKITALACSESPEGHANWSLRLLADKVVELGYCEHISHNYVGVILKKMMSNPT